jgi:hypothetical protein
MRTICPLLAVDEQQQISCLCPTRLECWASVEISWALRQSAEDIVGLDTSRQERSVGDFHIFVNNITEYGR